jgi:hypothetical protein
MASPASKHAHHLSVDIGPRAPTSGAEAQAAHYCAEVLEGAGIRTRIQPFRGFRSFGQIYIPTTAAILAGALLGTTRRRRRILGTAIGTAGIAAFWGEQTSRFRPLTDRFASGPSQNVVGILEPSREARRRLVLVAHVDSSRSGLMFHPRLARDFRRNTLAGVAAGVISLLAWFLPRPLRRLSSALSTALLATSLAQLIEREAAGQDVNGGNDNASGAGVMLALAETLAQERPAHTEIWFLATGCEEADLIGMSAFINRHQKELEDAWFVGLDSVAGEGATLRWITTSSILEALHADPHLVRLAEEVAAAHPEFEAASGVWQSAGLDTDVAAVRGLRAMSVMALTREGTLPNWHWPTDTYENVDEGGLERCYGFTLELIRRFDAYA